MDLPEEDELLHCDWVARTGFYAPPNPNHPAHSSLRSVYYGSSPESLSPTSQATYDDFALKIRQDSSPHKPDLRVPKKSSLSNHCKPRIHPVQRLEGKSAPEDADELGLYYDMAEDEDSELAITGENSLSNARSLVDIRCNTTGRPHSTHRKGKETVPKKVGFFGRILGGADDKELLCSFGSSLLSLPVFLLVRGDVGESDFPI